jgi:hypothetical protein
MITLLGEYPSLAIGTLLDSHQHDVDAIMRGSLGTEAKALALYRELLTCAEGRSVMIEEYARQMVYAEESFTQAKSTRCSASLAKSPPSVLFEHPPEPHLSGSLKSAAMRAQRASWDWAGTSSCSRSSIIADAVQQRIRNLSFLAAQIGKPHPFIGIEGSGIAAHKEL